MRFKVAILQERSCQWEIEANLERIRAAMEAASRERADILLLPECFLTGYALPVDNGRALPEDDAALEKIRGYAQKYRIGVVATALTRGERGPRNSAFVIGGDGAVLMKYAKVHTCDFSDELCLESGREFPVCDFHGVKLGVMICYDREYPESARILMLKGAELILVPNDCAAMRPRLQALSTRAYENMVGIAMANPPGKNAGNSCAYSPICWDEAGNIVENTLLLAGEMEPGLFYAEFDMEKLRAYRASEMMGNTYRRPEVYSELVSTAIREPFLREHQRKNRGILGTAGRVRSALQQTHNRFLNLYELEAVRRNGQTGPYFVASRVSGTEHLKALTHSNEANGVIIYAVYGEKKDKLVLVRQFRYPVNDYVYEFPAGLVEPGEEMAQAGIREIFEETGLTFVPRKADGACSRPFFTTVGMTDESCGTIFGYCKGTPTNSHQEDSEDIQIVLADREECRRILKEENVAIMCAYMMMHFIHSAGEDPLDFLGEPEDEPQKDGGAR